MSIPASAVRISLPTKTHATRALTGWRLRSDMTAENDLYAAATAGTPADTEHSLGLKPSGQLNVCDGHAGAPARCRACHGGRCPRRRGASVTRRQQKATVTPRTNYPPTGLPRQPKPQGSQDDRLELLLGLFLDVLAQLPIDREENREALDARSQACQACQASQAGQPNQPTTKPSRPGARTPNPFITRHARASA